MILRYTLCICVIAHYVVCKVSLRIDINTTKIHGPGLRPDLIVLPVRYFFIETSDRHGERINKSAGDVFKVQVEGESQSGSFCRVWVQVLDRYDGTYIARYRIYQTCYKTSIHVLYKHKHVADSPYEIEGPIYSEDCYCPLESLEVWKEFLDCPEFYPQITKDLQPFKSVNMDEVLVTAAERFNQPGSKSFCNYIVQKNQVYRRCYGQHVGFNMFMDNILHSLARKVVLPDLDFIVNLGDWPLVDLKTKPLIPIFSWCGSVYTADIVVPTYDLTEATLEMMGRVLLDMLSVQSNNKIPWSKKKAVAFWKGRDSRQERLDLVTLARKHPDIINASLTNFFFFKDKEDEFGPKTKHESFFRFFDYKYQINIDGTVSAYRFPYLLAGTGVVLKQESPYYEHFYNDLEPYVHFIPFKRDLSDLVEKINWAIEHDNEAETISKNGRRFATENLLPKDIVCYHALLFEEWSRRVSSEVRLRDEMEHIPIKEYEERFGNCNCHRLGKHDEL